MMIVVMAIVLIVVYLTQEAMVKNFPHFLFLS